MGGVLRKECRKKERKDMTNKAKVGDIELAYTSKGEGDLLILIGGFSMVKEMWERQVADLSQHFRVIAFNNRGVGESTITEPDFTIADMAADVVGLMDYLQIDKTHVFGVSMGGLISQMLALDSRPLGSHQKGRSGMHKPWRQVRRSTRCRGDSSSRQNG
jgi:pimeloyl-ACP methyl ester carboxylesterase